MKRKDKKETKWMYDLDWRRDKSSRKKCQEKKSSAVKENWDYIIYHIWSNLHCAVNISTFWMNDTWKIIKLLSLKNDFWGPDREQTLNLLPKKISVATQQRSWRFILEISAENSDSIFGQSHSSRINSLKIFLSH